MSKLGIDLKKWSNSVKSLFSKLLMRRVLLEILVQVDVYKMDRLKGSNGAK